MHPHLLQMLLLPKNWCAPIISLAPDQVELVIVFGLRQVYLCSLRSFEALAFCLLLGLFRLSILLIIGNDIPL